MVTKVRFNLIYTSINHTSNILFTFLNNISFHPQIIFTGRHLSIPNHGLLCRFWIVLVVDLFLRNDCNFLVLWGEQICTKHWKHDRIKAKHLLVSLLGHLCSPCHGCKSLYKWTLVLHIDRISYNVMVTNLKIDLILVFRLYSSTTSTHMNQSNMENLENTHIQNGLK